MRFINNHLLKLIPLNFINCEIENSGYKKKTNIIILLVKIYKIEFSEQFNK